MFHPRSAVAILDEQAIYNYDSLGSVYLGAWEFSIFWSFLHVGYGTPHGQTKTLENFRWTHMCSLIHILSAHSVFLLLLVIILLPI